MQNELIKYIIDLIEKNDKLPPNADVNTFNYIDTGFVDSIGIMKFIVKIEEKYDIEISESDIESIEFRTIGGLKSIISKKIDAKTK